MPAVGQLVRSTTGAWMVLGHPNTAHTDTGCALAKY